MSLLLEGSERAALESVVRHLEAAWNAADGGAFGAPFAPDADFVTIRAEHYRGRKAIAEGHAAIFRSIYAGSSVRYTVEAARLIRPDTALLHVRSALDAPAGPLAGHHGGLFTMVLTRQTGGWEIVALHNMLVPPAPGAGR
jgi:uncharacterized protein (TIGR02246 family)